MPYTSHLLYPQTPNSTQPRGYFPDRGMPWLQDPQAKAFAKRKLQPGPVQPETSNFPLQRALVRETWGCTIDSYYKTSSFRSPHEKPKAKKCLDNQRDNPSPKQATPSFNERSVDSLGELNDDFYYHTLSVGSHGWFYYSINMNEVDAFNMNNESGDTLKYGPNKLKYGPNNTTGSVAKYMCVASMNPQTLFLSGYTNDKKCFWTLADMQTRQIEAPRVYDGSFEDAINVVAPVGNLFLGATNQMGGLVYIDVRQNNPFTPYTSPNSRIANIAVKNEHIVAVGLNADKVEIYDVRKSTPLLSYVKHGAAVRGMAFSPFDPSLIATGGGTADQTVQLWNWETGRNVGAFKVNGQVTGLQFLKKTELVGTIGYGLSGLFHCRLSTLHGCEPIFRQSSGEYFTTSLVQRMGSIPKMEPVVRMEPVQIARSRVPQGHRAIDCVPNPEVKGGFMTQTSDSLLFFRPDTAKKREEKPKDSLSVPILR